MFTYTHNTYIYIYIYYSSYVNGGPSHHAPAHARGRAGGAPATLLL